MTKYKVTVSFSSLFDSPSEAIKVYDEARSKYLLEEKDFYIVSYAAIRPENTLTTTVNNCQRCQDNHIDQEFTLLNNTVDDYHYFSICPYTNQPILLKVEEEAS